MSDGELIAFMPVYNEEANIATVITEWLEAFARERIDARLLALNDGSTDATLKVLKQLQLQFRRGAALCAKRLQFLFAVLFPSRADSERGPCCSGIPNYHRHNGYNLREQNAERSLSATFDR